MNTVQLEKAKALYAEGKSLRAVERETGVGRETLRQSLGVKTRGRLDFWGPNDQRIISKIGPPDPNGCWPWLGQINNMGYGLACLNGRTIAAHRAVYTVLREPAPRGLDGCHRCDNPPCVNPDHIFFGTRSENMADMVAKGRALDGERSPSSVLTLAQVREIRARVGTGVTQRKIASDLGVNYKTVNAVLRGRSWARSI